MSEHSKEEQPTTAFITRHGLNRNLLVIMKNLLIAAALMAGFLSLSAPVEARTVSVHGYYKPSIGRYVAPSHRTAPNRSKFDNYSTKGNFNPFTGRKGTSSPFKR